jgi:hypothetical protein
VDEESELRGERTSPTLGNLGEWPSETHEAAPIVRPANPVCESPWMFPRSGPVRCPEPQRDSTIQTAKRGPPNLGTTLGQTLSHHSPTLCATFLGQRTNTSVDTCRSRKAIVDPSRPDSRGLALNDGFRPPRTRPSTVPLAPCRRKARPSFVVKGVMPFEASASLAHETLRQPAADWRPQPCRRAWATAGAIRSTRCHELERQFGAPIHISVQSATA